MWRDLLTLCVLNWKMQWQERWPPHRWLLRTLRQEEQGTGEGPPWRWGDSTDEGSPRDADEEKQRVEKWISSLDVDSGWRLRTIIKKGFVWITRKTTGITPDVLRKAKRITPSALDAVLDLPIYLGKDKGTEIRAEIFKKIDEAMSRGVDFYWSNNRNYFHWFDGRNYSKFIWEIFVRKLMSPDWCPLRHYWF